MNSFCTILFLVGTLTFTFAANCFGPANTANQIIVNEFTAFPSPVAVGETLYIRAKVTPGGEISSANVRVRVYHSTSPNVDKLVPILDQSGLDFCTLSSKFGCPLTTATSILTWDFLVPDILPGTYQVLYNIIQTGAIDESRPSSSCIQFPITVSGPRTGSSFTSWYSATLMGSAVFTDNTNYSARQVGQAIQVGPAGPLNFSRPPYGTISRISGSGDLVPPTFSDTLGFVWGLSGFLIKESSGPRKQKLHYYEGTCYLGYVKDGYNYNHDNPLLVGKFALTWTYIDGTTAQINGEANFARSDNLAIPPGWGYPFLFGQIPQHVVVTSDVGFLMINGNKTHCTTTGVCESASSSGHSSGVDTTGLIVGLVVAGFLVIFVVLITAGLLWYKRRRETEQEDGIFAVARKPEYGSALVVDDIIEETKGNKNLRSMLNRNKYSDQEESDEEDEDDDDSDGSRSRSRSRSISERASDRSPSFSRSRSRSSSIDSARRGSSRRSARDQESDPGESASRTEESYDE